jgi:hypothetical protein
MQKSAETGSEIRLELLRDLGKWSKVSEIGDAERNIETFWEMLK